MSHSEYHHQNRQSRENAVEVMHTLQEHEPCSMKDLQLLCLSMGRKQVKCAVDWLQDNDRVIQARDPNDARVVEYLVNEP